MHATSIMCMWWWSKLYVPSAPSIVFKQFSVKLKCKHFPVDKFQLIIINMIHSAHKHEKTLAKHRVTKTYSHIREKNKNFPFAIANRITTFSTLRSCNQEKKHWSMDNTLFPSFQIPPVFLKCLSITNNNGLRRQRFLPTNKK